MAYVENQLGCFKNKCWNDHSLSATDTLYLELLPEDSGSEVVPETPPHSRPQEDEGSDLTEPSTDSTGNQHLRHTDKQKVTVILILVMERLSTSQKPGLGLRPQI